ncbi:MAG TPA: acyl-CoA reductase [Bryobacteraceae bacterium]|nr:acyl-CoA reductase [Bryobacteraceae bacterium]
MCDSLTLFESASGVTALALPVSPAQLAAAWSGLRAAMRRAAPAEFSRDEWAYLMAFLDPDNLNAPFMQVFGRPVDTGRPARVARPRGTVAVWLPNNVSLLGPLTFILLTLTGNRILLKGGSRSQDLTGTFLAFARRHLAAGPLRDFLAQQVCLQVFAHGDAREQQMIEEADVRIVFGSSEAAAAIHGAAPALRGTGFSFTERQSQAWIEAGAASDDVLRNLIRVFAIYGQVGCTSPRRVVLLDGTRRQAEDLRSRLIDLWPRVLPMRPPVHVASANTMTSQWAAASGWDVAMAANRHAVIGVGDFSLEVIDAPMFLPISPATVEEAAAQLPPNIQTIGHAFLNPDDPRWLGFAASSHVKRLVPLAHMHHFGPLWDGERFWSQCFEEVEIRL